MSLRSVVLGFLNYGPMTGYELKKVFDASVSHFWRAELSQIYPTLKTLEADGLLDKEVLPQEGKPDKKVYTITDDGRRELIEWLATPAVCESAREPLNVKLFFGAALGREELVHVIDVRLAEVEEMLASHEHDRAAIGPFIEAIGLPSRHAFFWTLTADSAVSHMSAEVEWLKEARNRIQSADDDVFAESDGTNSKISVERMMKILGEFMHAHASAH